MNSTSKSFIVFDLMHNILYRKMTFAESRETEHFELIKVKDSEI